MPGSMPTGAAFISSVIKNVKPKTVLDVGVGSGAYSRLMRQATSHDCVWTGVEIWQPNVDEFGLIDLYDELVITDIRNWDPPRRYDLCLVDVVAYMNAEDATATVKKLQEKCDVVILYLQSQSWPYEGVLRAFNKPMQQHVEGDASVYVYDQRKQPSIFINIASYKDDKELWETLTDAVAKAKHPERLRFAVVDQTQDPIPDDKLAALAPAQIEYLHLHYRYGRGPCWARAVGYTYLYDEDYVLQIDSHMRFDPEWDEWFVENINTLQVHTEKPYLSSFPYAYNSSDKGITLHRNNMATVTANPAHAGPLKDKDPTASIIGTLHTHRKTIPGCHIAAGAVFGPADLFRQVPIDPALYFMGEEQNFTIRAFTHGWDLFHVAGQPIFHLYNNSECTVRAPHWNKEDEEKRKQRWWEHHDRTLQRLVAMLYEKKDLGAYGLGKVRTLKDFADKFGIDYENKMVTVGVNPAPKEE